MTTLTENVLQQFDADTVEQIGQQLGVDQQTARKGIGLAVPLLVTALARNSSSQTGAQSLSNALARDHDGSILANLPAAVDNYQSGSGDGIVRHVLGDRREEVEDTLSQSTGVDAAELLKILAPIVLGALGNMQRQQKLDPSGLAGSLQNEQQQLNDSNGGVMDMITKMLDSNKDGSIIDEVASFIGQLLSKQQSHVRRETQ
jgi:hypothetical protein